MNQDRYCLIASIVSTLTDEQCNQFMEFIDSLPSDEKETATE